MDREDCLAREIDEKGGSEIERSLEPVRGERGRRVADLGSAAKVIASSNLLDGLFPFLILIRVAVEISRDNIDLAHASSKTLSTDVGFKAHPRKNGEQSARFEDSEHQGGHIRP